MTAVELSARKAQVFLPILWFKGMNKEQLLVFWSCDFFLFIEAWHQISIWKMKFYLVRGWNCRGKIDDQKQEWKDRIKWQAVFYSNWWWIYDGNYIMILFILLEKHYELFFYVDADASGWREGCSCKKIFQESLIHHEKSD